MFEDTEQDSENEIGLGEVSEGGLGVKRIILTETGTLVYVPHEDGLNYVLKVELEYAGSIYYYLLNPIWPGGGGLFISSYFF